MAHEITIREDGKAEMAFAAGSEQPWHFNDTNPTEVPANAGIAEWTVAAGMDWTVIPTAVQYEAGGLLRTIEDRYVLHRSDTFAPLGIVSGDYAILHPGEVLGFFDSLVKSIGLTIETAGTLFGGKRFWALAKVGEQAVIDQKDIVKGYVLLSSSADGARATEARHTSVRVVCNNTLSLSDRIDSANQIKVSHRSLWDQEDVKRRLGLAPAEFGVFMDRMRKLAGVKVSDSEARDHVRKLLGKEDAEVNAEGKTFGKVMDLFRGLAVGNSLDGVDGTAFGLLNSVTEAVDHLSTARSDSHRFANALMGSGEKLKAKFRNQMFALVD
jgi:phage/plasmid-like protein (TIGR03299 family)